MFRWIQTIREARLSQLLTRARVETAKLRDELTAERSKSSILEMEREQLLEIIERDRRRVQAETSNYAAAIAASGEKPIA